MRLGDLGLIADQNVTFAVVQALRSEGVDIVRTHEIGLARAADEEILRQAAERKAVVITHDSDFGRLAFLESKFAFGIVYLRPGTLPPNEVVDAILRLREYEVEPPFALIARVTANLVSVRYRPLSTP